jgi:hypothetical protein
MPLKLERRSAVIGSSINTRTEKHGEEDVAALDIPLLRIGLDKDELCEVLLEKHAYKLLYNTRRGRPDEPLFGKILRPFRLVDKITGANVNIFLGRRTLKLVDVNLPNVQLDRQPGGTTWLSCQVQCTPTLDESIETLLSKLNATVDVSIECESYGAQPDLPLEPDPDEPQSAEELFEKDPPLSRTGRKIAAAAAKKQAVKDTASLATLGEED